MKSPSHLFADVPSTEVTGTNTPLFSSFISHTVANTEGATFRSVELGTPPSKSAAAVYLAKAIAHTLSVLEIKSRGNGNRVTRSTMCDFNNFHLLKSMLRSMMFLCRSSEFNWSDVTSCFFSSDGEFLMSANPLLALLLFGTTSKQLFASLLSCCYTLACTRAVIGSVELDLKNDVLDISQFSKESLNEQEILIFDSFEKYAASVLEQNHSLPSPFLVASFLTPFLRRCLLLYSVCFETEVAPNIVESNSISDVWVMSLKYDIFGPGNSGFCHLFSNFVSLFEFTPTTISKHNNMLPMPNIPFSITNLPDFFHLLYYYTKNSKCTLCDEVPTTPALCLACGSVICVGDNKKVLAETGSPAGETWQHCYSCTGGIGAFLLFTIAEIEYLYHGRTFVGSALYLDCHGEPDPGFKIGLPLRLHSLRVEALERMMGGYGPEWKIDDIGGFLDINPGDTLHIPNIPGEFGWRRASISLWIYFEEGGIGFHWHNSPCRFNIRTNQVVWGSTGRNIPFPLEKWFHLVITFDQSEAHIYVDGNYQGSVTSGTPYRCTNDPPAYFPLSEIDGLSTQFKGRIRAVQVFTKTVTTFEINLLTLELHARIWGPGKLSIVHSEMTISPAYFRVELISLVSSTIYLDNPVTNELKSIELSFSELYYDVIDPDAELTIDSFYLKNTSSIITNASLIVSNFHWFDGELFSPEILTLKGLFLYGESKSWPHDSLVVENELHFNNSLSFQFLVLI
ncbi:hypothetical protein GEMRC1_009448 [Eukaryota sp. GEM-RC1]